MHTDKKQRRLRAKKRKLFCQLLFLCVAIVLMLSFSGWYYFTVRNVAKHEYHKHHHHHDDTVDNRYIVSFKQDSDESVIRQWIAKHKDQVSLKFKCKALNAMVIRCKDPDLIKELQEHTETGISAQKDELCHTHLQDTLEQIDADKVHSYLNLIGGTRPNNPSQNDIKVCVVDTGVALGHNALKVTESRDFTENGGDGSDDNGHGTFIAGIIQSSDTTYLGVSPGVSLYAAKVCDKFGSCLTGDILEGMEWCAKTISADIINISLGSGEKYSSHCDDDHPLAALATALSQQDDVLVVASAGNDFLTDRLSSPSCSSLTLSVGAVDKQDNHAPYSNAAEILDIVGPGGISTQNILSTTLPDNFGPLGSGTSYAAAHVAAVAALVKQANPLLTSREIFDILLQTANDLGALGKDQIYGYGRVNALNAVLKANPELADQVRDLQEQNNDRTEQPRSSDNDDDDDNVSNSGNSDFVIFWRKTFVMLLASIVYCW